MYFESEGNDHSRQYNTYKYLYMYIKCKGSNALYSCIRGTQSKVKRRLTTK